MPRFRLGVALLVPRPIADEVDVLRRACGEEAVDHIAPHITLVPPVNVREDRMGDALAVLRAAAAATRPINVALGPPTTFLPVNPVLYLSVAGNVDAVQVLRDRVFVEPLARTLTWAFHPHVTVRDGGEPEHLNAAAQALSSYRGEVTFGRVHLLREERDDEGRRRWCPVADAPFAAPSVVGRGGLELELTVTDQLDPEASAFREREWSVLDPDHRGPARTVDLAVTARRDARVVGTARGWTSGSSAYLDDLVVAAAHRHEGIGSHLVAAFVSAAAKRGCRLARTRTEADALVEGFWQRVGWFEEARLEADGLAPVTVQLRRNL